MSRCWTLALGLSLALTTGVGAQGFDPGRDDPTRPNTARAFWEERGEVEEWGTPIEDLEVLVGVEALEYEGDWYRTCLGPGEDVEKRFLSRMDQAIVELEESRAALERLERQLSELSTRTLPRRSQLPSRPSPMRSWLGIEP